MPHRTYRLGSLLSRLVLLALAGACLAVLRPAGRANPTAASARTPRRRSGARRIAVSLSFATLFFAGAAFSAGAGDVMVQLVENQAATAAQGSAPAPQSADAADCERFEMQQDAADACPSETASEEGAPEAEEAPPAEAEAAVEAEAAPAAEAPAAEAVAASPETASPATAAAIAAATASVAEAEQSSSQASSGSASPAPSLRNLVHGQARRRAGHDDGARPVIAPQRSLKRHAATPDPEVHDPGSDATIWLHRALPDPTPPSKRLSRQFARNLRYASARNRVHWSIVLGVLRADGHRGSAPAGRQRLNRLARDLSRLGARRDEWNAVLALEGRTAFADRAVALARYHRAVGLRALVRGLEWARPMLAKRLLADMRVSIYPGGRHDIESGKTDVRVIVLIRYLAEAHGQVTVSSLTSGHRIFSRPGVVSAHTYGQAVDIAALENKSIIGNQEPGGLTERAVRNMLLLPAELRPMQLISLLGLGGPSFPMGNHDDHIHAGY